MRALLFLAMLLHLSVGPVAAANAVLEFRRTFASDHCNSGEVYLNGSLVGQFLAAPNVFTDMALQGPIVGEKVTTQDQSNLIPYIKFNKLGITVSSESSARVINVVVLDDDRSYVDYDVPRKKARSLPDNAIVVGTKISNRQCFIEASAKTDYLDYDPSFDSAFPRLAQGLFSGKVTKANFVSGISEAATVILGDRSGALVVVAGGLKYISNVPIRAADGLEKTDPCLLEAEHLGNANKRTDRVWFCTNGKLLGAKSMNGLEWAREVRYISILSHEICERILGLPLNRTYLIMRKGDGTGGEAFTRCAATEAWKRLTDQSQIIESSSPK